MEKKHANSFYYVFVNRSFPAPDGEVRTVAGVERWMLSDIRKFIYWNEESEMIEEQGLTYGGMMCKIFITEDMKDLAIGDKNIIDF